MYLVLLCIFAHAWTPSWQFRLVYTKMKLLQKTLGCACCNQSPTGDNSRKKDVERKGKLSMFFLPKSSTWPFSHLMALMNVSYHTKMKAVSACDCVGGRALIETVYKTGSKYMAFYGVDAYSLQKLLRNWEVQQMVNSLHGGLAVPGKKKNAQWAIAAQQFREYKMCISNIALTFIFTQSDTCKKGVRYMVTSWSAK